MGDHSLFEPKSEPGTPEFDEQWPAPDVSCIVEVKVVVASLVTLLSGVAVALLNAVQDSPGLLAGWPPWAQFVVLTAIPPALAFLAGYAKTSNRVE